MSFISKFLTSIGLLRRKASVLIVGLDNSGKSTLIAWLKHSSSSSSSASASPSMAINSVTPTVGFNVEHFSRDKLNYTVFDMSGSERYRHLWENYYSETNAIIFVIDSSDKIRVSVAREELESMLKNKDVKNVPVLLFANKMDVEQSMTPEECSDELGLNSIKDRAWHICACSALKGTGVSVGLDWLADQLLQQNH